VTGKKSDTGDKREKGEITKNQLVTGTQREVEGLIKQMNLLALNDPQYGLAYYRAIKLDSDVRQIVTKPVLRFSHASHPLRPSAATYQQSSTQGSVILPPPHQNNLPPPPRGSKITCYGCGEKGHGMLNCLRILELINKGQLTRDHAGRVVHGNRNPICCIGNGTCCKLTSVKPNLSVTLLRLWQMSSRI